MMKNEIESNIKLDNNSIKWGYVSSPAIWSFLDKSQVVFNKADDCENKKSQKIDIRIL